MASYYKLDPKIVDVDSCICIGNAFKNSRYVLKMSFITKTVDDRKTAIVIMKNPSSSAKSHLFYDVPFTNIEDIDATTNNVINILYKGTNNLNNITDLILLNLFPYFSPSAKDINAINDKSSNERKINNFLIKNIIKSNPKAIIIFGWGKPDNKSGIYSSIMKKEIKEVYKFIGSIDSMNCYEYINKKGFCKINNKRKYYYMHASQWK